MSKLLLIGFAGFVGTLSRYWMSGVIAKRYGETFPMGTLVVNLLGCFLVGLLFYRGTLPRQSSSAVGHLNRLFGWLHHIFFFWITVLYIDAGW